MAKHWEGKGVRHTSVLPIHWQIWYTVLHATGPNKPNRNIHSVARAEGGIYYGTTTITCVGDMIQTQGLKESIENQPYCLAPELFLALEFYIKIKI